MGPIHARKIRRDPGRARNASRDPKSIVLKVLVGIQVDPVRSANKNPSRARNISRDPSRARNVSRELGHVRNASIGISKCK